MFSDAVNGLLASAMFVNTGEDRVVILIIISWKTDNLICHHTSIINGILALGP